VTSDRSAGDKLSGSAIRAFEAAYPNRESSDLAREKPMDAHADAQRVKTPKFEPLEPRLLLDAGGGGGLSASLEGLALQASPIVTPALEYESHGGPANDDPASAQELEFSYLLPKISPFDGFGPRQASVTGSADAGCCSRRCTAIFWRSAPG